MEKRYNWSDTVADSVLQQKPIIFIRNGYYGHNNGMPAVYGIGGRYWENETLSELKAQILYSDSIYLAPQDNHFKGHGFTIRCLVR